MPILSKKRISRVNARRLLDDMASMYSHSLEETVVVEAIANSLDAGCSTISFEIDTSRSQLTILDDGRGMTEQEFSYYHDLAESTKIRGQGIGFAGLGAKLSHKLATLVRTETRRDDFKSGSDWYWKGDDLEFVTRRCRIKSNGTRVDFELADANSPLLDADWLKRTVQAHYSPLVEPSFSQYFVISSVYPNGIKFVVNGVPIKPHQIVEDANTEVSAYRDIYAPRGKKIIGRAFFAITKTAPAEPGIGVAISTMGKVIRTDTLGMFPRSAGRIVGLVDVPELVECLTTSKQDFIDSGKTGARYRRLRTQIQKAYSEWLTEVGENVDVAEARRAPRALERELAELARLMPELDFLFGHRQRSATPIRTVAGNQSSTELQGTLLTEGADGTNGHASTNGKSDIPSSKGDQDGTTLGDSLDGDVPSRRRTRNVRRGPSVRLVSDSSRREVSWIEFDAVNINTAHPAYVKAQRENQVRYHRRVAALLALCSGASAENQLELLHRAIAAWGSR